MSIDGLFINNLVRKLNKDILSARINKVIMVSANEFLFNLYAPHVHKDLFVSLLPVASYLTLTDKDYAPTNEINHFHELMRKHIEGYHIFEITQYQLDRIIKINLIGKNNIGQESHKFLYIELMGRYNNMVLTKEDNTILGTLHALPFTSEEHRVLLPSYPYQYPANSEKESPFESDKIVDNLADQYQGIAPSNEGYIKSYLKNHSLKETVQFISTSDSLYYNDKSFCLLPDASFDKQENIYDGLTSFYEQKALKERAKRKSSEANKFVHSTLKKINVKLDNLREDLDKAQNASTFKEYGELLFTYQYLYKKGASHLYIEDANVDIPLDESKDLVTNANNYFKQYKKKIAASKYIEEQIEMAEEEKEYFEDLLVQLDTLDVEVIDEINDELKKQNYLHQVLNSKKKDTKIKVLEFYSPNNTKISVGRNNLQNEYLTFKIAKEKDIFMHVKDYRGAHVIIHDYKGDEDTLRYAAKLAALYSKAKYSSSVPIDYTEVRYVKKLKAAKPGKVILSNYQTIYIDPND